MEDSRSTVGQLSRGNNVYNGGTPQAHSGGGFQYGRPKKPRPLVPSSNISKPMYSINPLEKPTLPAPTLQGNLKFKEAISRRLANKQGQF